MIGQIIATIGIASLAIGFPALILGEAFDSKALLKFGAWATIAPLCAGFAALCGAGVAAIWK